VCGFTKNSETFGPVSKPTSPYSNVPSASSGAPGRDGTGLPDACEVRLSHTTCSCWEDLDLPQLNVRHDLDIQIAVEWYVRKLRKKLKIINVFPKCKNFMHNRVKIRS